MKWILNKTDYAKKTNTCIAKDLHFRGVPEKLIRAFSSARRAECETMFFYAETE